MRKFYEVGSTAYSSSLQTEVTIVFAEQLHNGNIYMVRYETHDTEDVYDEDFTRIIGTKPVSEVFHERIFDHHTLGHPDLFDSKEDYEKYQNEQIEELKSNLLAHGDLWMHELFQAYSAESGFNNHTEAMRQVIKEKTGIDV
jgi:hypothetical protein